MPITPDPPHRGAPGGSPAPLQGMDYRTSKPEAHMCQPLYQNLGRTIYLAAQADGTDVADKVVANSGS